MACLCKISEAGAGYACDNRDKCVITDYDVNGKCVIIGK